MKRCVRCDQVKRGRRIREMCEACYRRMHRRSKAYGRWESPVVSSAAALARADALIALLMPQRLICEQAGISKATLVNLLGRRPEVIAQSTSAAILAVPIPESIGAWIAQAPDDLLVPALGSSRRLKSMVRAGFPVAELDRRLGFYPGAITRIMHRQRKVFAYQHRAIVSLFAQLQFGPSADARAYGKAKQWPLPFQWDEDQIDEPTGRPVPNSRRRPKRVAA